MAGSRWNHRSIDYKSILTKDIALEVLPLQQHNGWAFTLDATPSPYDNRSQMWIFGLCAHTMSLGQLRKLGAITGLAPGAQTKARALLAGLVALAKHTEAQVKVIV